jgi:bifunctional UDP-N-acetylglucosamine pyrophosphorylase/glucosamine-1-phosphate N-acetyltransferase
MRRSLLAVVWAGRDRRSETVAGLPLCGKSVLRWSVEKAAALRPERIFILGAPDKVREEIREAAPAVGFLGPDEAGPSLKALRAGKKPRGAVAGLDIFFLDIRLALVRTSTLAGLLERHAAQANAATALAGEPAVRSARPAPGGESRRAWGALVVRLEDFLEVAGRSAPERNLAARLPGLPGSLAGRRKRIAVVGLPEKDEPLVVRSPEDASRLRALLHLEKCLRLERHGVILLDRAATWVDWDVRIGAGTILHPAVVIEGRSVIGPGCRIGPFVHLVEARVGRRVRILGSTVVEGARIGDEAHVGPYSRFRPGTIIKPGARVGNFVEMKNTVFGRRSLASHLSYLGDATVGDDVNIGAGTITCNFDRFKKNRTDIESGAFIGSGTELVAPVKIGQNAVVGAGSTITKNVSPWALAVARGRQVEFKNWAKGKPRS